jgi:hypothetical protein
MESPVGEKFSSRDTMPFLGRAREKSLLFLKKKKQKDFYSLQPRPAVGTPAGKSFLLLFSKKEVLACRGQPYPGLA